MSKRKRGPAETHTRGSQGQGRERRLSPDGRTLASSDLAGGGPPVERPSTGRTARRAAPGVGRTRSGASRSARTGAPCVVRLRRDRASWDVPTGRDVGQPLAGTPSRSSPSRTRPTARLLPRATTARSHFGAPSGRAHSARPIGEHKRPGDDGLGRAGRTNGRLRRLRPSSSGCGTSTPGSVGRAG